MEKSTATEMFEPPAWDERYSGDGKIWSGDPNPQLVAEVSGLEPGTGRHAQMSESHRGAMFLAADLVPALPGGFEPLVVEQRPRSVTRGGETVEIDDSTLLARRG